MPPKSARKRHAFASLEKARAAKRERLEADAEASGSVEVEAEDPAEPGDTLERDHDLSELATMSDEALNTEDEDVDPTFDLDSSVRSDVDHMAETFCEDWVSHLEWDDCVSLSLFLCFQLTRHLGVGDTKAAELAGMMVGKSDRAVREWRKQFFDNEGEIPEFQRGKYKRSGVMWESEELNKKATRYIRENASVKGRPNLTVNAFRLWVNNDLLPNETLEPGFPRKIGYETARKWMHELGFSVVAKKKGSFVDGHEREDVVEYRKVFLRRMVALGFLNRENAPTEAARDALPTDLEMPQPDILDKTVVLFHDESTFQANDDQRTVWAQPGTNVMLPKSKGSGIMVSDFIEEKGGYLHLTDEEYERAKESTPSIRKCARQLLEYGEAKEGYWTSEKFMKQIVEAEKIAVAKYPKEEGWRLVWIFDHSSCHAAMPEDSLDVAKMNVNPGGKQRVMRDGWWNGQPQKMNYKLGVAKGMRVVLEERGIDTRQMNADRMREVLGSHPDFRNEKSSVERYLGEEKGHIVYMLPKFHPELNPIERVWAQAKRYSKAYCKYSIVSLRKTVMPALESVPQESIEKHFRKVRHYMFAYLEGLPGGTALEKLVKKYKKAIKSHRRISDIQ